MSETLNLKLKVWRQSGPDAQGFFETYDVPNISTHMSFLEMLDILNSRLESEGKEPIVFEHDCREGICGACGFMINGQPVSLIEAKPLTGRTHQIRPVRGGSNRHDRRSGGTRSTPGGDPSIFFVRNKFHA